MSRVLFSSAAMNFASGSRMTRSGRTRSVRCSPSDFCTYDLTIKELGYRVDLSMETSV